MAELDTDGNNNDLHLQLSTVDSVTPISHFISDSDSSPINSPFSHPHGRIIHQVSGSERICDDTMTLESKSITPKFSLPEDWFVEKRLRSCGSTFDKHYHDPETGKKFRSLKDVERYLTEGITPARSRYKRLKYHIKHLKKCNNRKKFVSNRKKQDFEENEDNQYQLINLTPSRFLSTSPFTLPNGWIVEKVPRKTGDRIDRFFIEPRTGHKFRSLPSVKRHLAELEDLMENNLPLSKSFKLANPIKNYGSYNSWKKSISKKEQDSSFSNNVPNKINWVITSTAGNAWNVFIGDELVPDSIKQQWEKRFVLAISNTKKLIR